MNRNTLYPFFLPSIEKKIDAGGKKNIIVTIVSIRTEFELLGTVKIFQQRNY